MASLKIELVVAADPTENVHSHLRSNGADVWEIGPMLERAIADLQQEMAALPNSHWPEAPTTDA